MKSGEILENREGAYAGLILPGTDPLVILSALDWESLQEGKGKQLLEELILPTYLPRCRWFAGKSKTIRYTKVQDVIPAWETPDAARMLLIEISYVHGLPEVYLLPMQIVVQTAVLDLAQYSSMAVIAFFDDGQTKWALLDGIFDRDFRRALLKLVASEERLAGRNGVVRGIAGQGLGGIGGMGHLGKGLESLVLKVDQSNSSIAYADKLFLKLYRKLESGMNPDAQIIRFLSEKQHFAKVPPFAGAIEYQDGGGDLRVLGLFLGSVKNQGNAWDYTLKALRGFYERIGAHGVSVDGLAPTQLFRPFKPSTLLEDLQDFPDRVRQLAQATGEMHLALAAESSDPQFCPEAITADSQRILCESMEGFVRETFEMVRAKLDTLAESKMRAMADQVMELEEEVVRRQKRLLRHPIHAALTRTHGDYHLGQVLFTGNDFVIIDFEGEPSRPLQERMLKRSPLRDVAGMLRSFHYAAHVGLAEAKASREEASHLSEQWANVWAGQISWIFLDEYLKTVAGACFIPEKTEDLQILLEAFLLEKAIYEVLYELNNRPAWLPIPFRGILDILV